MRNARNLVILLALLVLVHAGIAAAWWWVKARYELAAPHMLWGLCAVPVLAGWYAWRRNKRHPRATLSTLRALADGPMDIVARLRHLPFCALLGGLGMLILALARPQSKDNWHDEVREGIDIIIAMDFSASMLAKDFRPDRLEAARTVAMRFIDDRPNDRIGLVVYEGEAFTQCPLTTDHTVLNDLFLKARSGLVDGGTAVGMGLATAVNRLRDSDGKSKVIILLTDGVNNKGTIQPLDAAQIAQQFGMRVYTIGVGSRGKALSPVAIYPNGQYKYEMVPVEIDEDMLKKVADMTGGKYFRATDEKKLKSIYAEIDKLEKTRVKVMEHSRRNDEYSLLLSVGCALFALGSLLEGTLFRNTP